MWLLRKTWVIVLIPIGGSLMGLGSCDPAPTVDISVFHTNDIHSRLRAAKTDPFGLGGLARLSTLLKQLRQAAPNSLTLDAGDWSEGSWYFSVDVGANMLHFLKALGYDAAALGNHDFLAGPDYLVTTTESQPGLPVLAANLDASTYKDPARFNNAVKPSRVFEVGGIKVGVIGVTTYEFIYDTYLTPVRITNPLDAATAEVEKLRSSTDVRILVSHNGFEINKEFARAVPGIHAVISGHAHVKIPKAVIVQNAGRDVPVVETGAWGKFLGEVKLSVNKETKLVKFEDYKLHPVTPDLEEDSVIAQMVNEQDALLSSRFTDVNMVVAESELEMLQGTDSETALGNLAVKAYRASAGADLSLEEVTFTAIDLPKGPVTLMDLHDVVPHLYNPATGREWAINLWNARGKDLNLIFNVFYAANSFMPLGSPIGWLSGDNVNVVWDPRDKTSPVKSINVGGQPLDSFARYKVALSNGLLDGIRQAKEALSLDIDDHDVVDTGIDAWQAIATYAQSRGTLRRDEFKVGNANKTVSADLAIFYYTLDWDGQNLKIEVANHGNATSISGSVSCSSGLPNDLVSHGTTEQKWTEIGSTAVPSLTNGESVTVQIPWDSWKLDKGYWPVECAVTMADDQYVANDKASKVFKVER